MTEFELEVDNGNSAAIGIQMSRAKAFEIVELLIGQLANEETSTIGIYLVGKLRPTEESDRL